MLSFCQRHWQRWRRQQHYRVFILPSRYGVMYAVLILIMLLGAINYNNSLGHLLSFLLVGVGHVAMHHSYRNVRQLDYQLGHAEPTFCEQPIRIPITLTNKSPRPIRQLDIAYRALASASGWWPFNKRTRYSTVYKATAISTEQSSLHLIPIPTTQRGWLHLGQLRLSSVYPVGLLYSWFFIEVNQRVLVYPKPEGNKPLPRNSAQEEDAGLHYQQGLDDFAGFHRYREGDARQHIAWKALARDGVLRTKQFSRPTGQNVMLQWEDVAELQATETKLSQLCQWVITADAAGMQYSLIMPNHVIALNSGEQHRHQCLQSLALYGQ